MNNTKQFIEDAIEGGYADKSLLKGQKAEADKNGFYCNNGYITKEYLLLDPKAWQAVGKTRGWSHKYSVDTYIKYGNEGVSTERWLYEQHRFIDHLADGLSIEEALGKLV